MITIDGKEFTKDKCQKNKLIYYTKINELDQKKNLYQFELNNTQILIQHYITKFKEITPK